MSASQTNEIPGFVHTKLSQFVGNPLSGSQSSTPESAPTVVPARGGAAATSFRVEATNKLSNNQWVVAMWGKVLNHAGQPRTKQLHNLQKDYERVFLTNYPEGASPPSEVEVKKYHENRSAMAAISAHIASEVKDIPSDIVSKMKELTPLLLDITRGHVLTTELADLNTRSLAERGARQESLLVAICMGGGSTGVVQRGLYNTRITNWQRSDQKRDSGNL